MTIRACSRDLEPVPPALFKAQQILLFHSPFFICLRREGSFPSASASACKDNVRAGFGVKPWIFFKHLARLQEFLDDVEL